MNYTVVIHNSTLEEPKKINKKEEGSTSYLFLFFYFKIEKEFFQVESKDRAQRVKGQERKV